MKFLSEVRQYIIVNPIGDRKIHRTVKKTRSTTLEEEAYFLDPDPVELVSEQSYWSPDSLWSYNQPQKEASPSQTQEQKDTEWTWLGIVGEDETDYFSSKPISSHSTTAGTPYPYTQPTSTSSPSDIGEGSLSYYYGTSQNNTDQATELGLETEEVEDDPIDYLLSCTSTPGSDSESLGVGSLSPGSSSSGSDEQSSASEESSDDEAPVIETDVGEMKIGGPVRGLGMGVGVGVGAGVGPGMLGRGVGMGMGFGMGIGIVDDEKHRLYEQVMEEFNLEY